MDETLNAWFMREILAHEAALVRYLRRAWPEADEVSDLRQEIYVRVFDAARKARPRSPKSFLFTTARHLIVDKARHRRVVSIEAAGDLESLNVLVDELSPERRQEGRQELKRLAMAFGLLPPKCREVLWLRRVDQMPQKEVAKHLGISEKTVEMHMLKAMRRITDALLALDPVTPTQATPTVVANQAHGQDPTD
jgi:RNA polymerase sigma-70 factor (ECF subfamily)